MGEVCRINRIIERSLDYSGFENYPASEIADLFSNGHLGYEYARFFDGFGTFNGKNNIGHQKVRRAIYKNIMKNAQKAYHEFKEHGREYDKEGALYKMFKRAHDIYKKTLTR